MSSGGSILRRRLASPEPLVFFAGFFTLLFFRVQALLYPPYWDSVTGAFTEMTWLLDHQFNFLALATEAQGYVAGGARVYLFSIYPTAQAILYSLGEGHHAFLILNHLLSLLLASGIITLVFSLARAAAGTEAAVWAAVATGINPLFLSQSYAINLGISTLFFALAGARYFVSGRYIGAAVLSLLSFSLKLTSATIAGALAASYFMSEFKADRPKTYLTQLFLAFPCLLLPLELWVLRGFVNNAGLVVNDSGLMIRDSLDAFLRLFYRFLVLSPDIFLLLWLAVILSAIVLIRQQRLVASKSLSQSQLRKILVLSLLVCLAQLTMTLLFKNFLTRYFLLALPFLFLAITLSVSELAGRWGLRVVGAVLVAFSAANLFGAVYARIPFQVGHYDGGHLYERTLEYEDDMEANLLLFDLLEAKYRDHIIVTWWPYAQMLASETFCYVDRPFQVVTAGRPCLRWRNTASLDELNVDALLQREDVIWVWSDSCFSVVNAYNPATDRVVDSIRVGDRTILLFRRTPAAPRLEWRR